MYVQLNSVIVDADNGNRQELATFLGQFGVHPMAQLGGVDGLSAAWVAASRRLEKSMNPSIRREWNLSLG